MVVCQGVLRPDGDNMEIWLSQNDLKKSDNMKTLVSHAKDFKHIFARGDFALRIPVGCMPRRFRWMLFAFRYVHVGGLLSSTNACSIAHVWGPTDKVVSEFRASKCARGEGKRTHIYKNQLKCYQTRCFFRILGVNSLKLER